MFSLEVLFLSHGWSFYANIWSGLHAGRHLTLLSFFGAGHQVFKPKLTTRLEQGDDPGVRERDVPGAPQQGDVEST